MMSLHHAKKAGFAPSVEDKGGPTQREVRSAAGVPTALACLPGELEVVLTRLWQQVLQAERLDVDGDFFALGGDSLGALTLTGAIEKIVGHAMSLSVLEAASTPARMAKLLRESEDAFCWSETILLRPGTGRPPLFILPGRYGVLVQLHPLARALEAGVPVLGLPYHGPDGRHRAPESLEALAASLLPSIEAVQPVGPYQLVGFSFGGRVAFELARQLQARGHTVSLLGLLDTWGPGFPRLVPPLKWAAARLGLHCRAAWRRGPLERRRLPVAKGRHWPPMDRPEHPPSPQARGTPGHPGTGAAARDRQRPPHSQISAPDVRRPGGPLPGPGA